MNQLENTSHFHVEHRRPGLWIVACRSGAAARTHIFTIEIGQDRMTFEYSYRVSTNGSRDTHFPHVVAALDFCKAVAGLETAR
jgi:hypothetical protein